MGQKSNPISLRLEKTNQRWSNCWYGDHNYATQFLQDCTVNTYIQNCSQQLKKISPILSVKHQRGQLQVAVFSPRPVATHVFNINRNRRTPMWYAHEKEKRGKVHALNVHLSAVNDKWKLFKIELPVNPTFAFRRKPGRYAKVWMDLGSLLLASLLTAGGKVPIPNIAEQTYTEGAGVPKVGKLGVLKALIHTYTRPPVFPHNKQAVSWNNRLRAVIPQELQGSQRNDFSNTSMLNSHRRQLVSRINNLLSAPGGNLAPQNPATLETRKKDCIISRFQASVSAVIGHGHASCKIHLFNTSSIYCSPLFIASQVVFLLQQRVPFRQLKTRLISQLIRETEKNGCIKGVRVTCSGRVAARSKKAQKARTDSIQWGETKLNVLSELVHFASKNAQTTYGKLGVKVWVCYADTVN